MLRSSPAEAQLRLLDGALRLALLFNPSHAQNKRPVDQQLLRSRAPPPSSAFNFTKIRPNEVLCALTIGERGARPPQIHASADDASAAHVALVNVSPLVQREAVFFLRCCCC